MPSPGELRYSRATLNWFERHPLRSQFMKKQIIFSLLLLIPCSGVIAQKQNESVKPKCTLVDAPRPWATARFIRSTAAVSQTLPP